MGKYHTIDDDVHNTNIIVYRVVESAEAMDDLHVL